MGPEEYGYTMIVPSEASDGDGAFRDTALPFSESRYVPPEIPKRIRDMRRLYEYGRETFAAKVRNFPLLGHVYLYKDIS